MKPQESPATSRLRGMGSRKQLEEIAAKLQQYLANVERVENGDHTVDVAFTKLKRERLNTYNLKKRTVDDYTLVVAKFAAFVGDTTIGGLTRETWFEFFNQVARGSHTSYWSGLSSCINWLDQNGYSGLSAIIPGKKPRAKRRKGYLTDPQYDEFWFAIGTAVSEGWITETIANAIKTAIFVPMRREETASLKCNAVDFFGRMIRLDDDESKTGARDVPICDEAIAILEHQIKVIAPYVRNAEPGWVFPSHVGGHVRGSSLNQGLQKVIKRCGLKGYEKISFHALRHSWASRASRHGVPEDVIQKVMGHSTRDMTSHYIHSGEHDLQNAVTVVSRGIGRGKDNAH